MRGREAWDDAPAAAAGRRAKAVGPALEAFLRARGPGAVVTITTKFGYRLMGYLWRLETRPDGIVAVLTDVDRRFRETTEIVRLANIESVVAEAQ